MEEKSCSEWIALEGTPLAEYLKSVDAQNLVQRKQEDKVCFSKKGLISLLDVIPVFGQSMLSFIQLQAYFEPHIFGLPFPKFPFNIEVILALIWQLIAMPGLALYVCWESSLLIWIFSLILVSYAFIIQGLINLAILTVIPATTARHQSCVQLLRKIVNEARQLELLNSRLKCDNVSDRYFDGLLGIIEDCSLQPEVNTSHLERLQNACKSIRLFEADYVTWYRDTLDELFLGPLRWDIGRLRLAVKLLDRLYWYQCVVFARLTNGYKRFSVSHRLSSRRAEILTNGAKRGSTSFKVKNSEEVNWNTLKESLEAVQTCSLFNFECNHPLSREDGDSCLRFLSEELEYSLQLVRRMIELRRSTQRSDSSSSLQADRVDSDVSQLEKSTSPIILPVDEPDQIPLEELLKKPFEMLEGESVVNLRDRMNKSSSPMSREERIKLMKEARLQKETTKSTSTSRISETELIRRDIIRELGNLLPNLDRSSSSM